MIDILYDMRIDANGKDPDSHSDTLRRYHRILWSKELPSGEMFDLDENLHHKSELGEFWLSSDCIGRTFCMLDSFKPIVEQFPKEEIDFLLAHNHTIGAFIVFPANKINNKMTINAARGCNRTRIADRMDLTLECIRRMYIGEKSPLYDCLMRYRDFFDLFGDFRGYVNFFLLQDMVSEDYSEIKFWKPFSDFAPDAVPKDVEEFVLYKNNLEDFIWRRGHRIDEWANPREVKDIDPYKEENSAMYIQSMEPLIVNPTPEQQKELQELYDRMNRASEMIKWMPKHIMRMILGL